MENEEKCDICCRYDKVEDSNLCESCKGVLEWSSKYETELMFSRKKDVIWRNKNQI